MSKKNNNSDAFFRNQDTIVRRAWINTALEGVRSRLAAGLEPDAVAGNVDNMNVDANSDPRPPALSAQATDAANAASGSGQPGLYIAWSSQERRSGT